MHSQLEILLELQDLKAQMREMEEAAEESSLDIEREVFQVKPDEAIAQLQAKIADMERTLDPDIAGRYELLASRRPRAVAPVIGGMCYGCFTAVPTALERNNDAVRWCEHCGSFVYFVD